MTSPSPFSTNDLELLTQRGITPAEAGRQLQLLRQPPAAIELIRPCTAGDGIIVPSDDERRTWEGAGDEAIRSGRVSKFVPASGAATRMFKDLISAAKRTEIPSATAGAREFFARLDEFAFAPELRRRSGVEGAPRNEAEERRLLDVLLNDMRFAQLPKGLVPFHHGTPPRTAFEEQIAEGLPCTASAEGHAAMHFTVAPEFLDEFVTAGEDIRSRLTDIDLRITFSEQHPSTDTLALTTGGEPARDEDGTLLFRPGGHGSLIRNLQDLPADIVVIKNIDNVLPATAIGEIVQWKRILIGCLASIQSRVFDLAEACTAGDAGAVDPAISFAASTFGRLPQRELRSPAEKRSFAIEALDRPIRVCGVVRNEGEPGGAPFWVRDADDRRSIQIVESAQVDDREQQQAIFRRSTHFNPVDLVCGLRSWTGERFDLTRFIDHRAVFISKKSHAGRDIFALERPGLWNGAMAGWNTICVEVPGSTFAPVKTVLDLLRPQHRL